MENKEIYRCAYCGKEYDNPPDRARCELECEKNKKREEEKRLQDSIKQEKLNREKEITEMYKTLIGKIEAYKKDYAESSAKKIEPTLRFFNDWFW